MIQVFTQTFNWMAEALTVAENHKYQQDFYNSYLCKMFIFQLVNQYSAFIYIAVKQQFNPKGCPSNDCVGTLQKQLPMTLAVLVVMQIVEVVLATLQVKFKVWLEDYQLKKAGGTPQERTFVELQSKFGTYRTRELIESMTQLCLALGYVLIFAGIVPAVVPICFLIFTVRLRASAVLLTTAVNRPVPRRTAGLGHWLTITEALMSVGVLFTGFLLVNFGPLFKGTEVLTKVTGLVLYVGFVNLLWVFIDICVPRHSPGAELLEARRDHVAKKLAEFHQDKVYTTLKQSKAHKQKSDKKKGQRTNVPYAKEVDTGEWSAIPGLTKSAVEEEGADTCGV